MMDEYIRVVDVKEMKGDDRLKAEILNAVENNKIKTYWRDD